MPIPRRLEYDATQKKMRRRSTDLLLLDLRFPRGSSLALQTLNPSLESCAQGTCVIDEFFQPLCIARCCCIVCVVK